MAAANPSLGATRLLGDHGGGQPRQHARMTDRSPALALPDWVRPELQRLQQTAHSAVLLGGPGGAGQLALAYHLAAAWLCDAPTEHGMCGACPSCGNLQAQSH